MMFKATAQMLLFKLAEKVLDYPFSSLPFTMTNCTTARVLDAQTIAYQVFGTGEHIVLVIPGAIGTAASDFPAQLPLSLPGGSEVVREPHSIGQRLDTVHFCFVAVQLPGWGQSAPPGRLLGPNTYRHDANCCMALMEHLGHRHYSIIGWSDGAKVALLIAHLLSTLQVAPNIRHTHHRLRSLVLQGAITRRSGPVSRRNILWSRDLANWSPPQLELYLAAYSGNRELVGRLWREHVDFIRRFEEHFPAGNYLGLANLEEVLSAIATPTLLLHGERDAFVEAEQAEFLERHLPQVRVVRFERGAHNLHQTEPERWKRLVEGFLLAAEDFE